MTRHQSGACAEHQTPAAVSLAGSHNASFPARLLPTPPLPMMVLVSFTPSFKITIDKTRLSNREIIGNMYYITLVINAALAGYVKALISGKKWKTRQKSKDYST